MDWFVILAGLVWNSLVFLAWAGLVFPGEVRLAWTFRPEFDWFGISGPGWNSLAFLAWAGIFRAGKIGLEFPDDVGLIWYFWAGLLVETRLINFRWYFLKSTCGLDESSLITTEQVIEAVS